MLKKDINVSLGVDGSASNDSSDMLGEMRAALMLQRVKYGSDSLSVRDVFRLATVNGAKTLGYEGHLGKIKPGYGADIAVFDVDKLPYAGAQSDPIAALIFCGTSHETRHTIVNGEFTVRRSSKTRPTKYRGGCWRESRCKKEICPQVFCGHLLSIKTISFS